MSTATRSRNRVAPLRNADPATTTVVTALPSTPAERQAALADAVFAAVLALQAQLAHPDAKVVREAAGLILDFEKTRLRHDRPVAGTASCVLLAPRAGFQNPLAERAEHGLEPLGEMDPLPDHREPLFAATSGSGTPNPAPGGRGEEPVAPDDEPFEDMVEQVRANLQTAQREYGECQILTPDKAEQVARYFRSRGRPAGGNK